MGLSLEIRGGLVEGSGDKGGRGADENNVAFAVIRSGSKPYPATYKLHGVEQIDKSF